MPWIARIKVIRDDDKHPMLAEKEPYRSRRGEVISVREACAVAIVDDVTGFSVGDQVTNQRTSGTFTLETQTHIGGRDYSFPAINRNKNIMRFGSQDINDWQVGDVLSNGTVTATIQKFVPTFDSNPTKKAFFIYVRGINIPFERFQQWCCDAHCHSTELDAPNGVRRVLGRRKRFIPFGKLPRSRRQALNRDKFIVVTKRQFKEFIRRRRADQTCDQFNDDDADTDFADPGEVEP